ncbi:hypothetical protein JW949_00960 [Candidatus Woesearchaeota archaeon]|nr:hypothetical protein [Candidatus Woesearchaeota archaeon]
MGLTNIIKTSLTTIILGLAFSGCKCDAPKWTEKLAKSHHSTEKKLIFSSEKEMINEINRVAVEIWTETCEDYVELHDLIKYERPAYEIEWKLDQIKWEYSLKASEEYKEVCSEARKNGKPEIADSISKVIERNSNINSNFCCFLNTLIQLGAYTIAEDFLEDKLMETKYVMREFVDSTLVKYKEQLPDSLSEEIKRTYEKGSEKINLILIREGHLI